jgi:hypothetical protein
MKWVIGYDLRYKGNLRGHGTGSKRRVIPAKVISAARFVQQTAAVKDFLRENSGFGGKTHQCSA